MTKKKRKNKYIPHLAEFYFKPDEDWTIEEAKKMYMTSASPDIDKMVYEDCIQGMKQLPDDSIELLIADPPFGLDFSGKESIYNRNPEYVIDGYKEVNISDYERFTQDWISQVPRILKPQGSAYIFSGWTNLLPILQAINDSNLIVRNHILWIYNFAVFTKRKFATSHYHLLYVVKNEKKVYFNRINHYEKDIWDIPRNNMPNQAKNGTKLPVDLIRKCINYSCKVGDLVLDPFVGNGTTLVAAKGEYRHHIGFEINLNMKPIIDSNLSQTSTGQFYRPYNERIPSIEELGKKYPKAYEIYKKNISISQ